MKMYLPFGDWSNDGHGRYEKILIDAPSMEALRNAQIKIEEKYNKWFWTEFADEYNDPTIGENIEKELIETNYPIERFKIMMDDSQYEEFSTLKEVFESEIWECYVTLDLVIDAFIWILNAYSAQITRLDDGETIPMICDWTCDGFKTVGYGCFY